MANRLILTLAGRHPGDRDETIEGLLEGTTNRLADLGRLHGSDAPATVAARDLAHYLEAVVVDVTAAGADSPEGNLGEARRLLDAFDRASEEPAP